jgi:hypothetical protein
MQDETHTQITTQLHIYIYMELIDVNFQVKYR